MIPVVFRIVLGPFLRLDMQNVSELDELRFILHQCQIPFGQIALVFFGSFLQVVMEVVEDSSKFACPVQVDQIAFVVAEKLEEFVDVFHVAVRIPGLISCLLAVVSQLALALDEEVSAEGFLELFGPLWPEAVPELGFSSKATL